MATNTNRSTLILAEHTLGNSSKPPQAMYWWGCPKEEQDLHVEDDRCHMSACKRCGGWAIKASYTHDELEPGEELFCCRICRYYYCGLCSVPRDARYLCADCTRSFDQ